MTIYDFAVQDKDGNKVRLSEYKGKTVLIINSATECGFTPQYANLQDLYRRYQDKGFVILDFPCDQFGHQTPKTDSEIHLFCSSRFGIKFPIFHKLEVNGENESPLFKYLKSQKGFKGFDMKNLLAQALDTVITGTHLGIKGMKSRAAILNAKFEIKSSFETGTQVKLTVPLKN